MRFKPDAAQANKCLKCKNLKHSLRKITAIVNRIGAMRDATIKCCVIARLHHENIDKYRRPWHL